MSPERRNPVEQAIERHQAIYLSTQGNRFESKEYISSWKQLRGYGLPVWKLEQRVVHTLYTQEKE